MTMKVGDYKITWLQNSKHFSGIPWNDIDKPSEETTHFEDNGDGRSKYVYAKRNSDGHMIKVARAIRSYIFLPLLLFTGEVLLYLTMFYQFMDGASTFIILGCSYAIFFMFVSFFLFNGDRKWITSRR